jgi:hypothetical protein
MISRVVSVGFMLLFVALAGAPGPASPRLCPEAASASANDVTELALGVAHAFGSKAAKNDVQKQQGEPLACSTQGADEVVVVTAG